MSGERDQAAELAEQWTPELRRTGGVQIPYGSDEELLLYRRAGRAAGKSLDRPVTTHARDGILHILLSDWGDNPLEQRLEHARTRNAIDRPFKLHPER